MKTFGFRAPSRETMITALIERGIILSHEPEYILPIPDWWEVFRIPVELEDGKDYESYIIQEYGKAIADGKSHDEAIAQAKASRLRISLGKFDKEPDRASFEEDVEIVFHPAHDQLIPEQIKFDPAVLDTDGLLKSSSPITRTLKAAVYDDKGEIVTPAELDPNFYAVIRFRSNPAGDTLLSNVNKGGTPNTKFKLSERAEMKAERQKLAADDPNKIIKEVRSRKIGDLTIFPLGGEDGMSFDDLGRGYL